MSQSSAGDEWDLKGIQGKRNGEKGKTQKCETTWTVFGDALVVYDGYSMGFKARKKRNREEDMQV